MVRRKFDARKLMEKAIEMMRMSIPEPREDGKVTPLVGAVVYKADGTIDTAYRSELRNGDHAEYTVLERKNRETNLEDSKFFTTLEPCAPGSRHPLKLSCAERIDEARISEVWVGIEDPDPTVDRKGIEFLRKKGIEVNLFDPDLQKVIREENKEFITQALERAEAEDDQERPDTVTLSWLEDPVQAAVKKDFDDKALKRYRSIAKFSDKIDSPAFERRLLQQGLLGKIEGRVTPTGFGLLLFGKEPRLNIHHAGLLATIVDKDGKEVIKDFDGPMVLIPGLVEKWLNDKVPNVIDRSQMHRKTSSRIPFVLVREAIVNALVHRDYDVKGAKCQLKVTPDTILVRSPGRPPDPVTLEQLQSFSAPTLSRNPKLHFVFGRMDLAEERGLGMKTLRDISETGDVLLPQYAFEDPYLELTLFRSGAVAASALNPETIQELSKEEEAGWEFIASKISTTRKEYAEHMGIDNRKAQRHLKRFIELKLVQRDGKGPSTSYKVTRS